MTKKTYQRYSSEFKSLALRRASEDGVTPLVMYRLPPQLNLWKTRGSIAAALSMPPQSAPAMPGLNTS